MFLSDIGILDEQATFPKKCSFPLSQSVYLGIFETEMAHVVVDQAESKAPVHEGEAPLRRESVISKHAADEMR